MMIRSLIPAMLLVAVAVLSCKKDPVDPCADFNLSVALQAESNALSQAATAYGTNPSTANCNAYRTAFQNYLNAASDLQVCANSVGQGAEYQQAIANAQAGLDALQC